ncbi:VOC family protein [Thalassobaculum sp.]|jgi:PhnB protein|uniref:VOC family protein n=1 Tax=Thalassobaculum sp. TaxID=2022740 RepID=UPI003B5BD629
MQSNPYLTFAGDCAEAFAHYAEVLGGTINDVLRYGEAPDCDWVTDDWRNKVMHSMFTAPGLVLMGSDAPPQMYEKPQGISVALHVDSDAEATRIYEAFRQGGTVSMELQETFWASRFAMLVDRFGIRWIINCGKPEAAPA